jgi:hypothetical protein
MKGCSLEPGPELCLHTDKRLFGLDFVCEIFLFRSYMVARREVHCLQKSKVHSRFSDTEPHLEGFWTWELGKKEKGIWKRSLLRIARNSIW